VIPCLCTVLQFASSWSRISEISLCHKCWVTSITEVQPDTKRE
jgi:hypothetical protein